jgi:hypothetical protein
MNIAAMKKAARRRLSQTGFETDYLLAAIAAAPAAAEAAASATPEAAAVAAEATESAAEAAAAVTAEAAAAAGAATGAATSSFLPQAVRAAAAIRVANRSDLFICVLSESVDQQLPVMDLTHTAEQTCVSKPDPEGSSSSGASRQL